MPHGHSIAELHTVRTHNYSYVQKGARTPKDQAVAMNYDYKNAEARFSYDTHNYDKVINMEEFVDAFAQLHTRKLEKKRF